MSAVAPLNPRAPFVLDTRELGRRAGSMRAVRTTLSAPHGWGLDLVAVPPGSPVELDLRLESVVDGVLVTGTATVNVHAECGRCLDPIDDTLVVDLQELFTYEPDPGDDEQPMMHGDYLDLEPLVRDAVILDLPVNPVCDNACEGLCAGCGVRLSEVDEQHAHDEIDPRWAALSQLPTATSIHPASTHPASTHQTEN